MMDMPLDTNEENVERRISFDVPKSLGKTLGLGDSITATIVGKVCCLSSEYGDKGEAEMIRLEVSFSSPPKIVTNKADASVRAMMGISGKVGRTKNEADKSLNDLHDSVKRSY